MKLQPQGAFYPSGTMYTACLGHLAVRVAARNIMEADLAVAEYQLINSEAVECLVADCGLAEQRQSRI